MNSPNFERRCSAFYGVRVTGIRRKLHGRVAGAPVMSGLGGKRTFACGQAGELQTRAYAPTCLPAVQRAEESQCRVGRLQHIIPPHPAADRMREALLADRQIARLYDRYLRKNTP